MTVTGELDLRQRSKIPVDGGEVSAHDTEVALATPSGDAIGEQLPDLGRSDYAAYWTDGHRLVLIGLRARDVLLADPRAQLLVVVGQLERLEISDTYDPGGLESIRLVDVAPNRLAIVYEVGLAVLAARHGARYFAVECVCSDLELHRQRFQERGDKSVGDWKLSGQSSSRHSAATGRTPARTCSRTPSILDENLAAALNYIGSF